MAMRVNNGAWNLRDVQLHRGRPLKSFAIVSFDNPMRVSRNDPEGLEVCLPLNITLPHEQRCVCSCFQTAGLGFGSLV